MRNMLLATTIGLSSMAVMAIGSPPQASSQEQNAIAQNTQAAPPGTAHSTDQGEGGTDRKRLQSLQSWVGEWRGAGQLKRGSSEGGWTEEAAWVWRFDKDRAEIGFTTARGKYFRSGRLRPGKQPGELELTAVTPANQEIVYRGNLNNDGSAVLEANTVPADAPQRVTVRVVAGGDRMVLLLERRSAISDRFTRLAEIGYTRKGSEFGKGSSQPECVVTGGLGTIQVSYQGQMYFVCCAGCRDLFEQKPAEILEEYRQRKAAEAAKKKASGK